MKHRIFALICALALLLSFCAAAEAMPELMPPTIYCQGDRGEIGAASNGFTRVPIVEYFGWTIPEDNADEITVKAFLVDCEAGLIEIEPDKTAEDLLSLTVTGKENDECVTGGSTLYILSDKDGNQLASFEFYNGLLVTKDGMYRVE